MQQKKTTGGGYLRSSESSDENLGLHHVRKSERKNLLSISHFAVGIEMIEIHCVVGL